MVVFIDTSSLIKRYVEETGSSEIDRYFTEDTIVYISPLTPVEMNSALKRKLREGSICDETYRAAIGSWHEDVHSYSIVMFSDEIVSKAIDIVNSHDVKTLDAFQISAAVLSGADESVTSDRQMHRVLEAIVNTRAVYI